MASAIVSASFAWRTPQLLARACKLKVARFHFCFVSRRRTTSSMSKRGRQPQHPSAPLPRHHRGRSTQLRCQRAHPIQQVPGSEFATRQLPGYSISVGSPPELPVPAAAGAASLPSDAGPTDVACAPWKLPPDVLHLGRTARLPPCGEGRRGPSTAVCKRQKRTSRRVLRARTSARQAQTASWSGASSFQRPPAVGRFFRDGNEVCFRLCPKWAAFGLTCLD